MDCKKIKEDLGENWKKFEEVYRKSLYSENEFIKSINGHLLSNPGKMIRPMMALLSADCCGKINNETILCAVASEIMHTASLMHDDVNDDSDLRRGAPTVRKLYSSGASVLMGDFWLSKAIKVLLADNAEFEVLNCFAKALEELSEGELMQLQRVSDLNMIQDEYLKIIAKKTSSLFIAAVKSGVLSVYPDDSDGVLDAFEQFALHFGVAFQIKDDILDYSPDKDMGKPVCADIVEQKVTLPLIGAIRNALYDSEQEDVDYMMQRVKAINVSNDGEVQEIKKEVLDFINQYNGLNYAYYELADHVQDAIESLEPVPDSPAKQHLISIAKSLLD